MTMLVFRLHSSFRVVSLLHSVRREIRLLTICGIAVCGFSLDGVTADARAESHRKFPYEAIIDHPADVRSGPGSKYYATSQLSPGTRVRVHRHDPGGWYMIAPPEGSFSWIPAAHVTYRGGDTAVVRDNNVLVFVGSEFDNAHEVWQRRLSTGDTIRVFGKQSLQTDSGPVTMYKIAPPAGEFRWIAAQSCTPADSLIQASDESDPFSKANPDKFATFDTTQVRTGTEAEQQRESRPAQRVVQKVSQGPKIPTAHRDEPKPARERLRELDTELQNIVQRDAAQWNFAHLQREYEDLQATTSDSRLARSIESRFSTLSRYQQIAADYQGFLQLISETERRDAELQAKLRSFQFEEPEIQVPSSGAPQPTLPLPQQPPAMSGPVLQAPLPDPSFPGAAVMPSPQMSGVMPGRDRNVFFGSSDIPRFDGIGILQRAVGVPPGSPQYVLLRPTGEVVAYVDAFPTVDLESYVGQSVGVYAHRRFRPELQSQFLHVHALSPLPAVY